MQVPKLRTVPFGALKSPPTVNFVLATAVEVELGEMLSRLSPIEGQDAVLRVPLDSQTYFIGTCGLYNCALVKSDMGAQGRSGAHEVVGHALRTWNAYGVIAVGIAFGKGPDTQAFGDVLVSSHLIPYDLAKKMPGKTEYRAAHPEAGAALLNRLRNLFWEWTPGSGGDPRKPIFGPLLTGATLFNDFELKTNLLRDFPTAIGGEMEGWGVQGAASAHRVEWIIVKGICDWGYLKGDGPRPLAAKNSCDLVEALLREPGLGPADLGKTSESDAREDRRIVAATKSLLFRDMQTSVRAADARLKETADRSMQFIGSLPRDQDGNVPRDRSGEVDAQMAAQRASTEAWLNAYNDAAVQYLAGAVAEDQFRSAFATEICELFEVDGLHTPALAADPEAYSALRGAYEQFKATAAGRASGASSPTPASERKGKLALHKRSDMEEIASQGGPLLEAALAEKLEPVRLAFTSWIKRVVRLRNDQGLDAEDSERLVWSAEVFENILDKKTVVAHEVVAAIRIGISTARSISEEYRALDDRGSVAVGWESRLLQAAYDCFEADGAWPRLEDPRLNVVKTDLHMAIATLPHGFAQRHNGGLRVRWRGLLACKNIEPTYELCERALAFLKGRVSGPSNVRVSKEDIQAGLSCSQSDANKVLDLFSEARCVAGFTPGRLIEFTREIDDFVDMWQVVESIP